MVAYSFKKRFIDPIKSGAKRQTIRAVGLRRHARPGDDLQLYTAMRTKQCQLIGRTQCVDAALITIKFGKRVDVVDIKGSSPPLPRRASSIELLDRFAATDGFKSWDELLKFWDEEHDGIVTKCGRFEGVLIRWEALS